MVIQIRIHKFARNLKGVFCESRTEIIPNEPGQVMLPRENDNRVMHCFVLLIPERSSGFFMFNIE